MQYDLATVNAISQNDTSGPGVFKSPYRRLQSSTALEQLAELDTIHPL